MTGPAPGGAGQGPPPEYDRRSERRSARHTAERRYRSDRPARGILPAVLVIVVVIAAMAVSTSSGGLAATVTTGPATTFGPATMTTATGPPSASAPGSALLVVKQDGNVALVALFCVGPKGGVILGLPGITLLRFGDRFVRLAQAYSPESPATLAEPVADALAVPLGAVASVEWSDLRAVLAGAASDIKLPEGLDQQGADAGAVSAVLAALLSGGGGDAGAGGWWARAAIQGEADGFRAAVAAELALAAGKPWAGLALTGTVVGYDTGATYLEPDLQKAISVLSGTGAGS